jgi:hypothetical protein
MSTIKVSAIQDLSGGQNVSVPNAAKAWVNFNGTGTVAIRGSFNVSSITDNGTGDYTVNFANALGDGNYSAVMASKREVQNQGGIGFPTTGSGGGATDGASGMTSSSCRFRYTDNNGTVFNMEVVCMSYFR